MKLAARFDGLLKILLIGGALYLAVTWYLGGSQAVGNGEHARTTCAREIRHKFGGESVRVTSVKPNSSGYIVRASITVRPGTIARVYCLTNESGWVKDIQLVEH